MLDILTPRRLEQLAAPMANNGYGQYLKGLLDTPGVL